MKNIFLLLIAFVTVASLQAQPINKATADATLEAAKEAEANLDYYNALERYADYYEENRDLDIAFKIANMHLQLRDYNKAERWFKRIVNKRSRKKPNPYMPEARFEYARMLKMNGNYGEAMSEFQLYISEAEDPARIALARIELAGCEMGREMDPVPGLNVENLGKKVNSKYSEYSPILYAEDEMYFTAIQSDEVIVIEDAKEDFHSKAFISRKGKKGWGKPSALGTNINREGYHTANLTITSDGQYMFFTRVLLDANQMSESKLFMSKRDGNSWGAANEVQGVNGDYLVKQPAVGELFGKEVLFIVSDMEGGYGGFDIYYCTRTGDTYAPPVNLGEVINTNRDEETPYYRDGTLYFSSDGHPGIGGFDIFSSAWNGKTWEAPTNMGKGYNSSADDLFFSIDEEGYNGFLVSNRPGTRSAHGKTCCNDIWSVNKEKVVVQLLATTFTGKDPLNGATVELQPIIDGVPADKEVSTKATSNAFSFSLQRDIKYKIIARAEGYFPDSLTFETTGIETSLTIEKSLKLNPVPEPEPEFETYTIDEPIELENIFYEFESAEILSEAEPDLSVVLELMNKYTDMVIELSSHTDSRGTSGYNRKLSQRRAESAKQWLVDRGVTAERIQAVGYGESQIRNRCVNGVKCEDEEHKYNRRTEFKIVAGPTSIQIEKTRLKKKN